MLILIRKKYLLAWALIFLALSGMAGILWMGRAPAVYASGTIDGKTTIVVDPGHGGEDGGAVASDGTVESSINLAVAQRLQLLLRFCGVDVVMTRSEDVSIYSDGAHTLHEKKVSDLANRVALINGTEGARLVSIHQNCLPSSPGVQGAQVFYNTVDGAQPLAESIQEVLNGTVNAGHEKAVKKISPSIYLMKNVTAPAVLVECGFLSNGQETGALKTPDYQLRLAAVITAGILSGSEQAQEELP